VQLGLLVALLALTAARTTLGEPPFLRKPLAEAGAYADLSAEEQIQQPKELLRVGSAVVILGLTAAWAISLLRRGRAVVRHPVFGAAALVLTGFLLASAYQAGDRRQAINTALEQASLLMAAALAMQLAAARWHRRLVLVVIVAIAAMLGAKGLHQVAVEIPAQVADFERNKAERLTAMGHPADSPAAKMLETRLREPTTKGWFSLANPFGSLMVVAALAAAGLAADKWLVWRRDRPAAAAPKRGPPARKTGKPNAERLASMEVSLPLLAAVVSTLVAGAAAATWWLTGSAGAAGAGVLAALAAVGIGAGQHWAARHRGALLAAAAAVFLVGLTGVVAYGRARGGLPMRTLQVRWEYWTASVEMVRDRPFLGVGPGNFADPYLRYRLPAAEEAVKNPHNVIVQTITEYGLAGGTVYLALLVFLLVKLAGPRRDDAPDAPPPPRTAAAVIALLGAVWALASLWRIAAVRCPTGTVFVVVQFLPILGLAAGLLAAVWMGRPLAGALAPRGRFGEIALTCGLCGFALHNLSDFAFFQPGAAMVFWVAGGAILAGVRGRCWRPGRAAAAALAMVLTAAAVAAGVGVLRPVWAKSAAIRSAAQAYSLGRWHAAGEHLAKAVEADPLDAATAGELATLLTERAAEMHEPWRRRAQLQSALDYAKLAHRRHPQRQDYLERCLWLRAFLLDDSLPAAAWPDPPADLPGRRKALAKQLDEPPPADTSEDLLTWRYAQARRLSRAAGYAYLAGEYRLAIEHIRRALDLRGADGAWPILHDHLGDAHYRLGNAQSAAEHWRRFRRTREPDAAAWRRITAVAANELAPMDRRDNRMHLRLALLAWLTGQGDAVTVHLDAALAADADLTPESLLHFNEREKAEVDLLGAKARSVAGGG